MRTISNDIGLNRIFVAVIRLTLKIILLAVYLYPISSFADDTISGHYCYTFGDNESLKEAKEITRSLAIKNAIESYRIFVASTSKINNFQLTNDLIQVISSGYLKDLKVKKHSENGRKICDTVEAKVSPQDVENALRDAIANRDKNEANSSPQQADNEVQYLFDHLDKAETLYKNHIKLTNEALQHLREWEKLWESAPSDKLLIWGSRMYDAINENMDANQNTLEANENLYEIMSVPIIVENDKVLQFKNAYQRVYDLSKQSYTELERAHSALGAMDIDRAQDKMIAGFNVTRDALKLLMETRTALWDSYEPYRVKILNLIEPDPKTAERFRNRANNYLKLDKYDEAIRDYDKAIELDPKDARSFRNRGLAFANIDKYDEAIRDYDKAIELDPKDAFSFRLRGDAYVKKEKQDEAIRDYGKAVELDPKDARSFRSRGAAYQRKQQFDQAIVDFTKAIELNPKDTFSFSSRGNAYNNKGKYDEAIRDYDKTIELDPKDAFGFRGRGISAAVNKLRQHVSAKASNEFERLISKYYLGLDGLNEQSVLAEANKGGDDSKVREKLCEAYFYLGAKRLVSGDRAGASDYFAKSIKTDVIKFIEYSDSRTMLTLIEKGKI